jgi:hypothetical protein
MPQNINLLFKAEQEAADFNQRVAIGMTKRRPFNDYTSKSHHL